MSYKLISAVVAAAALAGAATRFTPHTPALLAHDTWAGLPSTITTTDGDTYEGVSLIRTEPDGYLVNYTPASGAVGVAKIKFARLSPEMQQQAGYDPKKAREFEAQVASAGRDLEQARLGWQQTADANKAAQQARIDQQAQVLAERAQAVAEMQQAQAAQAQAAQNQSTGARMTGAGFTVVGTSSDAHYVDGFQPGSGFQAGAPTSILGNLTPAHPAHR